jgi:hypothetical protein
MKATLTFVLLVFGIYINAQTPNIQYNPIDTTFTFSRTYTQSIKNEIEYLTKDRNLLDSLYTENKQIIRKLTIRDSLYSKEIEWYKQLDKNLREVDVRQNEIIRNQALIIISAESRLKTETKKAKNAEIWKDVYKYGWPLIGIIATFIIVR